MPQLASVDCKYGAPMGRMSHTEAATEKVQLFRVRINSGGYDDGGAYWGIGRPLFCCRGENFEAYRRADDREDAKRILLAEFPDLKFYR
jgi:hypothetical protein